MYIAPSSQNSAIKGLRRIRTDALWRIQLDASFIYITAAIVDILRAELTVNAPVDGSRDPVPWIHLLPWLPVLIKMVLETPPGVDTTETFRVPIAVPYM